MIGVRSETAELFAGPGEMRERCRALDWATTPLGPVEQWPATLRIAAGIVLGSGLPKLLLWGPELIQIYNDGYIPFLGDWHPRVLGIPNRECWPDAWDRKGPLYAQVLAGKTISFEDALYPVRQLVPNGSAAELYVTGSASPIPDANGVVGGVLITMLDTTAQVHGRAADERTRAIIDASLDGIVTMDHEGRIAEFSPSAEKIFGFRRSEVIGKPLVDVIVPPALREQHRAGLARYLATGEERFIGKRIDIQGLRADGSLVEVELSITRMPGAGPPMFSAFLRDITERLKLEEQLRQAQKMEGIGRLAGGIAHDFNNTVGAIVAFADFLQLEVTSEQGKKDLAEIVLAAKRASTLTHQLLAFSRQQVLQPRVLDLNVVIRKLDPMMRRLIGADITVRERLDASLGAVHADLGQIEQVLVNLVVNARDAMPEGGTLTLETENVVLDEGYVEEGHTGASTGAHVMLAVSDTGIGMDRETRGRIFEPFFTTKEPGKGTGLGLSTVFGIVKQSGGSIWVYSEPGQGTTFKIFLPQVNEPLRLDTPANIPAVERRGGGRILVVEDNEPLRAVILRILKRAGFEVIEASNGLEGLAAYAAQQPIEMIITDMVLPVLGGREMVRRLIAEGANPRVLYISGYTAEAMFQQSPFAPGEEFIGKPFMGQALLDKVFSVLQPVVRR